MAIRSAIEQGNIDASIEMLNDLDAEILDTNDELYFHLQLQKLVELYDFLDYLFVGSS